MFDLTGKYALVTGASGGIGGAIAKALHAAGATVGLSGTRVEPLEALAKELCERAHVLPCHLGAPEAVDSLPKQAIEAMGGLEGIDGYGKAAMAGEGGELEHTALWHVPGPPCFIAEGTMAFASPSRARMA